MPTSRDAGDKGGRPVSSRFVVLAHGDGRSSAAAHAKHVGKGHESDKDRVCQADCRDLQRDRRSVRQERVRHVVDDGLTRLLMMLGIAALATVRGMGMDFINSSPFAMFNLVRCIPGSAAPFLSFVSIPSILLLRNSHAEAVLPSRGSPLFSASCATAAAFSVKTICLEASVLLIRDPEDEFSGFRGFF
ncbi:MAG: hypothetical protein ACLR5X_10125 [Oscillospiraceae bacterium]